MQLVWEGSVAYLLKDCKVMAVEVNLIISS